MSETVFVITSRNTYHTSKTCCKGITQTNKNIQKWDREKAEAWGKTICKYCSGDHKNTTPNDTGWPI